MELRSFTICTALFLLAISQCSETRHAIRRRQAVDDGNYDESLLGDEANDDETLNDTENREPQPEKEPAVIQTPATHYVVKAGEDIRLECKVFPEKGSVVQWQRNSTLLFIRRINLATEDRYSIVEDSKDLLIRNAQVSDSGVYKCEVVQKVPTAINHTLLVMQEPRINSVSATRNGFVAIGSTLKVTCNITGSPLPTVLWSFASKGQQANGRLSEEDAEFQVEGDLYSVIITNAKKENAGQYFCYAINNQGNDQAEINVVIQDKPQVHVPKTIINSDLRIDAVLECAAHDELGQHIRWYKDGVLIEDSASKYIISTQGSHSNLTVSPTADSDFGTFTCEAENEYGSHNRSIELVQSPVIEGVDVEGSRMTWMVHSHQPIEEMEVVVRPISEDGDWKTLQVPVPEGKHHKYDISYSLEDKNLEPGQYHALVKVKNSKSWGGTNEPAIVTIEEAQPLYTQTASVFRSNSGADSIRSVYTAISTILMYLLVRML